MTDSNLVSASSSSCPVYAVVDKRKKAKEGDVKNSENIALYAAVDKTKKSRTTSNVEHDSGENKNELKATDSTTVGEKHSTPPVPEYKCTPKGTLNKSEDNFKKMESARIFRQPYLLIILIIFALSLLVIAFIICTAVSFSMISSLRSESDSNKQLLKSMQLEVKMLKHKEELLQLKVKILLNTSKNTTSNYIKQIDQLNHTITSKTAVINSLLGMNKYFPAPSCWVLRLFRPSSSSGYYWVTSSNGTSVRVYCEMTKFCGNITGGLTRITLLNNKNRQQICTGNLTINHNNTRCKLMISSCSQILFTSKQISYSHICGLLEGDFLGLPDGFHGRSRSNSTTINDNYVDGISLTYGAAPNRTHIWTFIGDEEPMRPLCPRDVRTFIGDNYSCLLWGELCSKNSDRCIYGFFRQLQHHVTEDIEMRICLDEASEENVSIGNVELYVW